MTAFYQNENYSELLYDVLFLGLISEIRNKI